jgi:excisionase family DNA binding protein
VYRLAKNGHIPGHFMLGRSRRWSRQSILDWAAEAQRAGGKTKKGR